MRKGYVVYFRGNETVTKYSDCDSFDIGFDDGGRMEGRGGINSQGGPPGNLPEELPEIPYYMEIEGYDTKKQRPLTDEEIANLPKLD